MSLETDVFERVGIHVTPAELEELIHEALARVVPSHVAADWSSELSEEETAALIQGGVDPRWRRSDLTSPTVRTAAEYAAVLASSLTVDQTANLLQIDPSRVRHRLAARTLYGIREKAGWRIPALQFHEGRLVPGIDQVLPRLPSTLHPLAVIGWLTRPNSDLHDDAEQTPVSPLDWLLSGRDPQRVAVVARHVGQYG